MPRTARAIEGGLIYHVMNRGNGRMRLFHKPADYDAIERVFAWKAWHVAGRGALRDAEKGLSLICELFGTRGLVQVA